MKRKTLKKVSLLLITIMILTVTGCGDKKEESKQTSSEAVQESKSTSVDEKQSIGNEEQESTFDFSQVFDNVEVNGKKVPFPFTLNDLGEDFTVDSMVEMGNGVCGVTLYYKEEKIADVYMKINSKEDFDKETKICELYTSDSNKQLIKINGLDCNTNSNEVKNIFKGFKEYVGENNMLTKIEERRGENYLMIFFDDKGNVDAIYMGKGE